MSYLDTILSDRQVKDNSSMKPVIIIAIAFILLIPSSVFAQIDTSHTDIHDDHDDGAQHNLEDIETGILVYDVEITVLDISNVDYTNGGYDLSFWIKLSSHTIDFHEIPPPTIDFVNGKISKIEHKYIDEHSYSAKVHGTFFTNMIFSSYPLLHLSLPIIVEPVQFESHQIKFVQSEVYSSVDSGLTILGLIYQDAHQESTEFKYPDGDIFSRFTVTYDFETPFLSPFLLGIFPILIMASFVTFLFGLNPTKHDIKIEMVIGILVAAIFFHVLDVGESLPPLEYLTLEDKIMTMLYIMLGVVMIEMVSQRKWNEKGDLEKAKQINKKFLIIFAAASITTIAIVFQL